MAKEIKRKPTAIAIAKKEDLESLICGDVVLTSFSQDYSAIFTVYGGKKNGKIELMMQTPQNYKHILSIKVNPNLFVFSGEKYLGGLKAISHIDKPEEIEFSKYTPKHIEYDEKVRLFKLTGQWHGPVKRHGRYKYHILINDEGEEIRIN